jgi:hypothetical protein
VQTHKKVSRVIVACRVIQPELEALRREKDGVDVRHLDQGLHRVPQKMAPFIQEEIDRVADGAAQIVLGYGLCSNGIVGVAAGKQGLIVPRCHDCIAFFLGSHSAYLKVFHARPGTYYLTPGWVAEKKDPLGIVEDDYAPRLGRETAVWAMEEELKNYSHITLINNGIGNLDSLRARAMENARFFKKEYEEIQGSLDYFKKLLRGPYNKKDFLFIEPGQKITQEMFLTEITG